MNEKTTYGTEDEKKAIEQNLDILQRTFKDWYKDLIEELHQVKHDRVNLQQANSMLEDGLKECKQRLKQREEELLYWKQATIHQPDENKRLRGIIEKIEHLTDIVTVHSSHQKFVNVVAKISDLIESLEGAKE